MSTNNITKYFSTGRFLPYFIFIFLSSISIFLPAISKVYFLEADFYQGKTQERKIILGKGEIISSDKSVTRVAVSDPNIADLQVLSEKQIFVRAKQLGICTLLVWEKEKPNPTRFDVLVLPDIDYLTKQLHELDQNIIVEYIPPAGNLTSGNSQGSPGQGLSAPPAPGAPSTGASSTAQGQSGSSSSPDASGSVSGKIILKGEVSNAEIIARALQIAGAYVGDQGIKIISQPGGQIVDGLAGRYDIYSNSDVQTAQTGQGSATSFGARDPMRFTSNRYANLSRGVIATTQKGSVVSFLMVKDPPQISVAIRFYEISRSIARNLGFNSNFSGSTLKGGTFVGGNGISQLLGSLGSRASSSLSQSIGQGVTGVIFNPTNGIGFVLQALQERGEIKTLAEPNLVIANGEPASFLAGGEVPILRSVFTAGGASTDVTYEPFGIKFNLLPTVTKENRIYLQLIPEIRDIDNDLSNFIAPPGSTTVRPPAFKTRRTQTQVELESGQAFAISGLLREDNTRNLRKVPGIGDTPILGTLFRSKSFRKGETELLIVVSPQIIRPTSANKIAKVSIPEVPYHDFDQLAPLKPYTKKDDEKGPEIKDSIDAGKYNPPPQNNEPPQSNDTDMSSMNPKEITLNKTDESKPQEIEIKKPVEQIISNQTEVTMVLDPPKNKNEIKDNPEKAISKFEDKFNGDEDVDFQTQDKKGKISWKKLKENLIQKRKAKEAKRLEEKKLTEELNQSKLIKDEETLKELWKKEAANYAKAQEAMRLARENKLYPN
ncbi:MAG: pilus assembly protein N-terminal domain-containing protein [Candidatus Melainabacteria bacterium]|nr:pilus assembly protein N-terminal domain-containing protein [Candidatus Melainabacteria bacterium]